MKALARALQAVEHSNVELALEFPETSFGEALAQHHQRCWRGRVSQEFKVIRKFNPAR
ncbi:MAG TPA: hypothetical protein VKN16_02700 [Methylomirabilota bacterium]|nr:hypothetical protein [Methylomirabilota bacterium]